MKCHDFLYSKCQDLLLILFLCHVDFFLFRLDDTHILRFFGSTFQFTLGEIV